MMPARNEIIGTVTSFMFAFGWQNNQTEEEPMAMRERKADRLPEGWIKGFIEAYDIRTSNDIRNGVDLLPHNRLKPNRTQPNIMLLRNLAAWFLSTILSLPGSSQRVMWRDVFRIAASRGHQARCF